MNKCMKTSKGMFNATIVSNEQIGRRFYRLGLEFDGAGAKTFAKTQPGQFAELDLSNAALPKTGGHTGRTAGRMQQKYTAAEAF